MRLQGLVIVRAFLLADDHIRVAGKAREVFQNIDGGSVQVHGLLPGLAIR